MDKIFSIFNIFNIFKEKPKTYCFDSDNGENYNVRGYVEYNNIKYYDICGAKYLRERYCENDIFKVKEYLCPYGCENGVCLEKVSVTKNVTTEKIIKCVSGWKCISSKIRVYQSYDCKISSNYSCPSNHICSYGQCIKEECEDECNHENQKKCLPSISDRSFKKCYDNNDDDCLEWNNDLCSVGEICQDGECVESQYNQSQTCTCIDADNGENYDIKSYVTINILNGNKYTYNDSCINSSDIREFACNINDPCSKIEIHSKCSNRCSNGVCINTCTPLWSCSSWSSCVNNQQTRVCTDINNCGTTTNRPITTQACCTPNCLNKQCGDDGCGSSCGTCSSGTCSNGKCVIQAMTISSVFAFSIIPNSVVIIWTTDRVSDSQVEYGITISYGYQTTLDTEMFTSHLVSLSGLSPLSTYHYRVKSRDAAGNLATSGDYSFTTNVDVDTTPPTQPTNLQANVISSSQINLAWSASSDNVGVSGYRIYRCTGSSCTTLTQIGTSSSTSYSNTGLTASTTYVYVVAAYDAAGNEGSKSSVVSGTTLSIADITPPILSDGSPTGTLTAGTISTTLSLTTNENANCKYSTTAGTSYSSMTNTFTTTGSTSHSTTISGLQNGQIYTMYIRCQDTVGNVNANDYSIIWSVSTPVNNVPILIAIGNKVVNEGSTLSISLSASDADGDTLSYSATNLPTGATFNSATRTFSWTPSYSQSGNYVVIFTVSDNKGGIDSEIITITVNNVIQSCSAQNGDICTSTEYCPGTSLSASDTSRCCSQQCGIPTWNLCSQCGQGLFNLCDRDECYSITEQCYFVGSLVVNNNCLSCSSGVGCASYTDQTSCLNNHCNFNNCIWNGNICTTSDAIPPTISSVSSSSITQNSAIINWNTNEASDTQIEYGTSTSYGSSTTINSAMVTSHSQQLIGLSANILYHYRVKSRDAAGNLATSGDYSFTTSTASDITPPILSDGSPTGTLTAGTISTTLSLTTNENANCKYSTTAGTSYSSMTNTFTTTGSTSHSTTISGLQDEQGYDYYVKCRDNFGNTNIDDYTITFAITQIQGCECEIYINNDNLYTKSRTATIRINAACEGSGVQCRCREFGLSTTWGSWGACSTKFLTLSTGEETKNVECEVRDSSGDVSSCEDSIEYCEDEPPCITEGELLCDANDPGVVMTCTSLVYDEDPCFEYWIADDCGTSCSLDLCINITTYRDYSYFNSAQRYDCIGTCVSGSCQSQCQPCPAAATETCSQNKNCQLSTNRCGGYTDLRCHMSNRRNWIWDRDAGTFIECSLLRRMLGECTIDVWDRRMWTETACSDGFDNDCDGLTDTPDTDC